MSLDIPELLFIRCVCVWDVSYTFWQVLPGAVLAGDDLICTCHQLPIIEHLIRNLQNGWMRPGEIERERKM